MKRVLDGGVAEFNEGIRARRANARLAFSTGELRAADVPATEFVPVGPGKPLTVMVRHVYTGRYPKSVFGKAKDMLAVSAMKGIEVYNASPRAVNFLKQGVTKNSSMSFAAATEEGTPLVFYSPALTQLDSVLSFEIVFDEFPKEAFDKVASTFQGLSGVPAFTPYSGVILAAGILTRLVGKLGEAIYDGDPAFRATESIVFSMPGTAPAVADFRLITDENLDSALLEGYELSGGKLVKTGTKEAYAGDVPYIVISLDGRKHDEYASFTPTAATAALLERFYRSQSSGSAGLEALVEGVKLYNDVRYRRKAEALKREIDSLPDGEQKTSRVSEFNAFVRNILSDELRLKELT
jgi:hypothetical protein